MDPFDTNAAFARHWDKNNPSDFVKACNDSRALREAEAARLLRKDSEIARQNALHSKPPKQNEGNAEGNKDAKEEKS